MGVCRRKLRPVRLGFLVPSGDLRQLARFIEFNTCLWGGMFNPIIPHYRQRPRDYTDDLFENPSAQEILLGHLETFEPDYIITSDQTSLESVPYPFNKRVLSFPGSKIYRPGEWHGLSIVSLLDHFYDEQAQHSRSQINKLAMASGKASDTSLLSAATLGRFPRGAWRQLKDDVKEFFQAKEIDLDPSSAQRYYLDDQFNLLWLGAAGLKVLGGLDRKQRVIFYLDANSFTDIVDFWNLRALGWKIVPCAQQWGDLAPKICNALIARASSNEVEVMKGRSISQGDFESFYKKLKKQRKFLIIRETHPRIWNQTYRVSDNAVRANIQSTTDTVEFNQKSQFISANTLAPNWVQERDQFGSLYAHWINVFSAKTSGDLPDIATVLPCFTYQAKTPHTFESPSIWNNSEGFVVGCSAKGEPINLELPTHWDVFSAWFTDKKLQISKSPAGQNVIELTRAIDGLSNAYYLACNDTLNIYQHLSKGHSLTYKQLVDKIKRASSIGGNKHHNRIIEFMTRSKSIRIGIETKCSFCQRNNWLSLADISESITCDRCLRSFPFPSEQPTRVDWSYRALGPFSMPDFAGGAYSVLLTARFFGWANGDKISWYPGIELRGGKNGDLEIDLAIWHQTENRLTLSEPALILTECKTFEVFEERDFQRAKMLLKLFPESTFVFATLREELTSKEIRMIQQLANGEMKRWRTVDRPLRVIVLTAHELFQNHRAPECWKEKAGNEFKFIEARYQFKMGHDKLQRLSNITQQLHLGMPDFYEFIEADAKKGAAKSRKQTHPT